MRNSHLDIGVPSGLSVVFVGVGHIQRGPVWVSVWWYHNAMLPGGTDRVGLLLVVSR